MGLVEKDLMLGFHEPVHLGVRRANHGTVTKNTKTGRVYFSTAVKKDFNLGETERASFRFADGKVFVVFNVPKDKGIPFYPLKGVGRTSITNRDLVNNIYATMENQIPKDCESFTFELYKAADIGLIFYELKFKATYKAEQKA